MTTEHTDPKDLSWLEQQIDNYKQQLEIGCSWLKFPQWLEGEYIQHRNKEFLATAKITLLIGIVFYMVMGAFDNALGQERGSLLLSIRGGVAFGLTLGLFIILNTEFKQKIVELAGVGIFIVSSSVLLFIYLIDEPYSYIYHFGLIPMQVYVLIVYRNSFRATLYLSLSLLVSFIVFSKSHTFLPSDSVIDDLYQFAWPLFVVFWAIMIGMGLFLTYNLELSSRLDFVKSRLLELDGQRLLELSKKLHILSTTDSLTALANRRHFESCLDAEWRRARRVGNELTVVMIDVDFFKPYNDKYGHVAGDDCLVRVAEVLLHNTQRSGELAGRYGGEEFILLLPGCSEEQAVLVADRVREQIEELHIESANPHNEFVTVSLGLAVVIPNDRISQDQLVKMADSCLYKAKEGGRNKVCHPSDFY